MLDNLNPGSPRDGRDGHKGSAPKNQRDHEVRPVVEREVPLGQQADRVLASTVHAWLDGELPEAAVRRGETARDVEFWRRMTAEMESRRSVRAPATLEARIMAALPQTAPQAITPWYRRELVVTPRRMVAIAAGVAAAAATVTAALMTLFG